VRIAFIGAGSVGFTRKLVRDMLIVPELQGAEFALHDISDESLRMVERLLRRDIEANRLPARIVTSLDRRRVLEGARYVVCCVRVGGPEAFRQDIETPLTYGVDQCVGDTICAGGVMYGQWSVPEMLAFCRDIRDVAEPGAWFMNYANPMAINTWALLDHGGLTNGSGSATVCSTVIGRSRRRSAHRSGRSRSSAPASIIRRGMSACASAAAAVRGDANLLKQAALHDPLVGAVLNPDEVWQMVDEMLVAGEAWLPQYAAEIPAARERLRRSQEPRRGSGTSTRRAIRGVDELRASAAERGTRPDNLMRRSAAD
jgi:alpha-galactosidase/6-phospho-beta-glucosidase family protein